MAGDECQSYCPCCNKLVNDSDNALECEGFCKNWYHGECVNISDEEYEQINKICDKVKWYCVPCEQRIDRVVEKVCDVEDFLSLNETVKNLINLTKIVNNDNAEIVKKLECVSSENVRLRNDMTLFKQYVEEHMTISNSVKSDSQTNKSERAGIFSSEVESVEGLDDKDSTLAGRCIDTSIAVDSEMLESDGLWTYVSKQKHNTSRPCQQGSEVNKVNDRVYRNSEYVSKGEKKYPPSRLLPSMDANTILKVKGKENSSMMKHSYSDVIKRNKVIYGTKEVSENMSIKPAERILWLFMSGWNTDVTADSLVEYLNSLKEAPTYQCEQLKTRYSNYNSFKVGVPLELGEELMHPNLWPRGVSVRKYNPLRRTAYPSKWA
ncbi:hypothetical protein J6590_005483 [Homalodisca vitripennis]|nr:hypothetical protein J6590_005483 [Homalodisca vitripennis]